MTKKLKCIKEVPAEDYVATDVIVGKIYQQLDGYDDKDDYYIKDETGCYWYYEKHFFEEIKE